MLIARLNRAGSRAMLGSSFIEVCSLMVVKTGSIDASITGVDDVRGVLLPLLPSI